MRKRGWQNWGLVGMAIAGTLWLGIPGSTPHHAIQPALAAEQELSPSRLVQREARSLAARMDAALARSSTLLASLQATSLGEFTRQRMLLSTGAQQWPVTLFGPGDGGIMQPPGERYLTSEDVADVQRRGGLVVARSERDVTVAVPTPGGQSLATRIPTRYFTDALASLPGNPGVRRYLLDASGRPVAGSTSMDAGDREWIDSLVKEGEGFLATNDSLYGLARVASLGWTVVIRYPFGSMVQPLAMDPTFLAGPAMVATAPLGGGVPAAGLMFPLVGAVLLFGLALVGWKQRWPGLEDGPLALGDRALRVVMDPLFKRAELNVSPPGSAVAPLPDTMTTALTAELPSQLPSALVSEDVEFLRSEQVRALRELWTHTEERLSGQRNWVREEVRRVHDTAVTGVAELRNLVNVAEQRLDDAKTAWGELQGSLVKRLDELRGSLNTERHAREDLDAGMRAELSQLARRMDSTHADLTSRLGQLEDDLDQLGSELGEVTGDRSLALGDERERVDAQLEEIERVLRGELEGVARDTARLEAALQERTGAADVLSIRTREGEERLAAFAKQLESLHTTVYDAVAGLQVITEAMQAKADHEAIHAKLDEMTRFVFSLHQAMQAKPDRDAIQRKIDEIAQVVSTLQAEHQRLRPEQLTLNGKLSEVTSLVKALQADESGREAESRAIEATSQRIEELKHQVTRLLDEHRARVDATTGTKLDELTGLVQQLANQGNTLAQAVDMHASAANQTESWVATQLGSLQEENQALREALKAMRGEQDALASRMHMMVQLVTKLSK